MKFQPLRAAGIFFVGRLALAAVIMAILGLGWPFERGSILLVWALVANLIGAILFWAGARIAGRPHTVTSLLSAIWATWTFVCATNFLNKEFLADVTYAAPIIALLQFAFIFMMGWWSAPRIRASPAAQGTDTPA